MTLSAIKVFLKSSFYRSLWFVIPSFIRIVAKHTTISITCSRIDGGGAQWHGRFSVMAFSNHFGFNYVHSNFHKVVPTDTASIRDQWSGLFRGNYTLANADSPRKKVKSLKRLMLLAIKHAFVKKELIVDVDHLHVFTNWFPSSVDRALERFGVRYGNPCNLPVPTSHPPTLVVHVRRGLDFEKNFTTNRNTDDKTIVANISAVRALRPNMKVIVYSGRNLPSLVSLLPPDAFFDCISSEFEVIHSMIYSDYLIMAKSCMSYTAGAFAKGIVYYDPFFHPPLSSWQILN